MSTLRADAVTTGFAWPSSPVPFPLPAAGGLDFSAAIFVTTKYAMTPSTKRTISHSHHRRRGGSSWLGVALAGAETGRSSPTGRLTGSWVSEDFSTGGP